MKPSREGLFNPTSLKMLENSQKNTSGLALFLTKDASCKSTDLLKVGTTKDDF